MLEAKDMTPETMRADGYKIDADGIIRSPGRYESEPWWIAVVEDWAGNGGGDPIFEPGEEGRMIAAAFDLDDDDRARFGLGKNAEAVVLHYSESGFLSVEVGTAAEVEAFKDRVEGDGSEEE